MPRKPGNRGMAPAMAASQRMAAILAVTSLALVLTAHPVSGQGTGAASGQPAPAVDTAAAARQAEALPAPTSQDTLGRPKSRADTVLVVQHSFNHRQQIITGSVVMSCLALVLVIMNNYNPR